MPDLNKIIEDLSSLTVAEAADLSKQLEEKWGVTPMAAAAPAAAAGGEAAADKDDFTIMLVSAGDKKINVIKEVRVVTALGLKEAKDLVEGAPKEIKSGVDEDAMKKPFMEPLIKMLDDFMINNFDGVISCDETFVSPYTMTNDVNFILDKPKSNITVFSGGSDQ